MFLLSKIFKCCRCGSGNSSIQTINNYSSIIYSDNSDVMYINNGNMVSSQTVVLPSAPSEGQPFILNSAYAIDALTLSSSYGIQGYSGPTYFAGTPPLKYVFNSNSGLWLIA